VQFSKYYGSPFRVDLSAVAGGLAPDHEFHSELIVLQPRTLSLANPAVRAIPRERQALFGCALFLTIVTDQVCYAHFRELYPRFRELTRYPKLRGDCPGSCDTNIHPKYAFLVGSRFGGIDQSIAALGMLLPADTLKVMRHEVLSFSSEHLPELGPDEFWERVDCEIPDDLRRAIAARHPAR